MSLRDGWLLLTVTYAHFVLFWWIRNHKYLGKARVLLFPQYNHTPTLLPKIF